MMEDGCPNSSNVTTIIGSSGNHMMTTEGLNVHIKQELDNGPCCSPSPSTMQTGAQLDKNFNTKTNCNVRIFPFLIFKLN